ncbi:histidine ammonia-lyase [Streptomyces sp. NPDC127159]|uniref:HAL/PAL/TAL family ammonia-lyase n=1 Tax=unclassified Streptomyces TaxID=2593676 RepID=UPI00363C1051
MISGESVVYVDGFELSLEDIDRVASGEADVSIRDMAEVVDRMARSRTVLLDTVKRGVPVYGVTTGFGSSVRTQVSANGAQALQRGLVAFLGCGTGVAASRESVRAMLLIRANSLVRGHSGIRYEVVAALIDLLNHGLTPVVPEEGSVGASGDLVPLSYIAASLMGTRQMDCEGEILDSSAALARFDLKPIELEEKEGLSIVNGTSFMTALGVLSVRRAGRIAEAAEVASAMSIEALCSIGDTFSVFLHDVAKPHPGQVKAASSIRNLLEGSLLTRDYESVVSSLGTVSQGVKSLSDGIQDPYSLRCSPHFIGSLWDCVRWVEEWLTVEVNSSNDNPLVDVDRESIASGGNFSGGHVGLAMDALRTAVASVADLIDRQLALLVDSNSNRGLPANLAVDSHETTTAESISHGFKGMQIACSSLAAEALSKCMPVTVFSRSTECHNQDKVSMATTAARATRDVVELVEKIMAIHLLALCQALDIRGCDGLGRTRSVYEMIRAEVPMVVGDREMSADIALVASLIRSGRLTKAAALAH